MSALEIVPPNRSRHFDAICDLAAKTFGRDGYWKVRDAARLALGHKSHYDWAVSRIGLDCGRIVAHWGVWGYRMRVGPSAIRIAGVGSVATDGDHRERGHMTGVGRASVEAMRGAGYHLSILFGRPDFYDRYGYVVAWPEETWIVRLADLPKGRPTVRTRRVKQADRRVLDTLYNRTHAGLTGTAVRPTYRGPNGMHNLAGWRWDDAHERPAGYVIAGEWRGNIEAYESAGDPEEVLRVLARFARAKGRGEIRFCDLHPREPMARHLRRMKCRVDRRHFRNGGPMVLVVNLAGALKAMRETLERRLAASALAAWRGRLRVESAREKATLVVGRGGAVRVDDGAAGTKHTLRGGEAIAQLLAGSYDPIETIKATGMRTTGEARKLAEVLFPTEEPRLASWDRF